MSITGLKHFKLSTEISLYYQGYTLKKGINMSESKALGLILILALAFFFALFDFLTFLVEEHPYIFLTIIGCFTVIAYRIVSIIWVRNPPSQEKQKTESPWSSLIGRKDIRVNGIVTNISLRKNPNQPDRLHVDWDGKMIVINIWKKQSYFRIEKGRRYLFLNISCRISKYTHQPEFHYDPEFYGSTYQEWPSPQQSQSSLAELLKEFGCSSHATIEEVKTKRKYWNQVLHPDFNVGKPEKLRNQMEEELKQKNELYDRIIALMDKR